jgi:DNA repair exonuclease SbcCD ATPase subunit
MTSVLSLVYTTITIVTTIAAASYAATTTAQREVSLKTLLMNSVLEQHVKLLGAKLKQNESERRKMLIKQEKFDRNIESLNKEKSKLTNEMINLEQENNEKAENDNDKVQGKIETIQGKIEKIEEKIAENTEKVQEVIQELYSVQGESIEQINFQLEFITENKDLILERLEETYDSNNRTVPSAEEVESLISQMMQPAQGN